jgi:CDP-glucose 4,6-dehydratase
MGGHDPYSASKGAAESVVAAYRSSFFNEGKGALLASVRAGNVIGGGDWAKDRLIPDIVRSLIEWRRVQIRSPHSVRPWQHVLEALGGYLLIAQRLAVGDRRAASAWNFGPSAQDAQPVSWVVERMIAGWGSGSYEIDREAKPHEAEMLKLDCSKAWSQLGWRPALNLPQSIAWIIDWHKGLRDGGDALDLTRRQIGEYRTLMDRALTQRADSSASTK